MYVSSSEDGFEGKFNEEFADREDEGGEGVCGWCEERIYTEGVAEEERKRGGEEGWEGGVEDGDRENGGRWTHEGREEA